MAGFVSQDLHGSEAVAPDNALFVALDDLDVVSGHIRKALERAEVDIRHAGLS